MTHGRDRRRRHPVRQAGGEGMDPAQPVITKDNLSQYITPGMPPLFYSTCGCQKMPGFPQNWGGK
jgi:hypothetical protein